MCHQCAAHTLIELGSANPEIHWNYFRQTYTVRESSKRRLPNRLLAYGITSPISCTRKRLISSGEVCLLNAKLSGHNGNRWFTVGLWMFNGEKLKPSSFELRHEVDRLPGELADKNVAKGRRDFNWKVKFFVPILATEDERDIACTKRKVEVNSRLYAAICLEVQTKRVGQSKET